MLDLQELQVLAQLIDNMEVISERLNKAYADNNAEDFNKSKQEILITQKQINGMIK